MTLVLLSISAVMLLNLQGTIIRLINKQSGLFRHTLMLQNQFFEPDKQVIKQGVSQNRVIEKTDVPEFIWLKYAVAPPSEKSGLSGISEHIYILQSSGAWRGLGRDPQELALTSIVYLQPTRTSIGDSK